MLSSMLIWLLFPGDAVKGEVEFPNVGCEDGFVQEVEPNGKAGPLGVLGADPKTAAVVVGAVKEDEDAPNANLVGVAELNGEPKPGDFGACKLEPKIPTCDSNGLGMTVMLALPAFVDETEELAPKLNMLAGKLVEVLTVFVDRTEELAPKLNMPGVALVEVLTVFVEEAEEPPPKLNMAGVALVEELIVFVEEAEEPPPKLNIPGAALLDVLTLFNEEAEELPPKLNVLGLWWVEVSTALVEEDEELTPKLNIAEVALLEVAIAVVAAETAGLAPKANAS